MLGWCQLGFRKAEIAWKTWSLTKTFLCAPSLSSNFCWHEDFLPKKRSWFLSEWIWEFYLETDCSSRGITWPSLVLLQKYASQAKTSKLGHFQGYQPPCINLYLGIYNQICYSPLSKVHQPHKNIIFYYEIFRHVDILSALNFSEIIFFSWFAKIYEMATLHRNTF